MNAVVDALPIGLSGLLLSSLLWTVVYFVGKAVSAAVAPTVYGGLTPKKRAEWDNYAMAFVHSVVAFLVRPLRVREATQLFVPLPPPSLPP